MDDALRAAVAAATARLASACPCGRRVIHTASGKPMQVFHWVGSRTCTPEDNESPIVGCYSDSAHDYVTDVHADGTLTRRQRA